MIRLKHILIAMALFALSATGAAAHCGKAESLDLKVRIDLPEPTIFRDVPSSRLAKKSPKQGRRAKELFARLNGLTIVEWRTDIQLNMGSAGQRNGCYSLTGLDIHVDVEKLEIYIASELAPGTCEYDQTMGHEMKHVTVFRDGIGRLQQRLADAAESSIIRQPIRAPDADTALDRYSKALEVMLSDIRQQETQRMARENALLDTPSNYRAEFAVCP